MIVGSTRLASAPANVSVIVPMPAVTVPAAVVTLPVPMLGRASSAASIAAMRVALTVTQVIGARDSPSNASRNVPPVGVPPIVSVCTALVPEPGTPANRMGRVGTVDSMMGIFCVSFLESRDSYIPVTLAKAVRR